MIRLATLEDLPKLETCAREFYASSVHLRQFDMERFIEMWSNLLTSGMAAIFLLIQGAEIVGTIGGILYTEPYSGATIAQEFFWFVEKSHRGGGIGLYRAFEEWAADRQAREIRMGHLCDLMPEKVAHFYERLGFHQVEVCYAKELTCAG